MSTSITQGNIKEVIVIGLAVGDFFLNNSIFPEKWSSGIKLHVIFALSSQMNYREGREISSFNCFETKYCSFFIQKYDI